jgi:hypothetical protein
MKERGIFVDRRRVIVGSFSLLALLLVGQFGLAESNELERLEDVEQIVLRDLNGKLHQPFQDADLKACVFIFVSPDCPIANAFQPELDEIYRSQGGDGIRFFLVYCCPDLKLKAVQTHVREYKVNVPAILDEDQKIGRTVQAKVTPEAIVVSRDGEVVYRGMINNLYAGYGKKRTRATEHYLRDACRDIRAGESPEVSKTRPIGCFIYYPDEKDSPGIP